MIYDLVIIGAGAAGLFAGASLPSPVKGLIIEKKELPGRKLLLSGSGQCNLTHGGSIKNFITHYGKNGKQIRSILYRFSNQSVTNFFESQGIPLIEREDGKIFPQSLQSQDVLNSLVNCCLNKGLEFQFSTSVTSITFEKKDDSALYSVQCDSQKYLTKKLLITSGGCSYPATGSDGNLFAILEAMEIEVSPRKPALVPIHVEGYPYQSLSGISFQNTRVRVCNKSDANQTAELTGALLFTHNSFSGPATLNISRYAAAGDRLFINYVPDQTASIMEQELLRLIQGNSKQLITLLCEYFSRLELPRRFLELICERCNVDGTIKASQTAGASIKAILRLMSNDTYIISGLGGYNVAMVTSGGVALSEVDLKTLESTRYPSMYFAGEVLDIDGDTGGYNLQFAFSSGNLAVLNAFQGIS